MSQENRRERGIAVLLLGGVAVTHLADLPHKLIEARYMAFLFICLIVASLVLSLLISSGWRPDLVWPATGVICAAAIVGYVISRVVPLPGMADHVGDWLNPDGIVALACELSLVSYAWELGRSTSRGASSAPSATYLPHALMSPGTRGRP